MMRKKSSTKNQVEENTVKMVGLLLGLQ